jgi:hypothetical protein
VESLFSCTCSILFYFVALCSSDSHPDFFLCSFSFSPQLRFDRLLVILFGARGCCKLKPIKSSPALNFSWICLSVSLPVCLDFQFLVPASQGDGGPAVHESSTLLLGACSSVVFFVRFLCVNRCREISVYLLSRRIKRLEDSLFKSLSRSDFSNAPTRRSVKCM